MEKGKKMCFMKIQPRYLSNAINRFWPINTQGVKKPVHIYTLNPE